jgi:MtN3 and saliva related transmembrane protein
VTAVLSLQSGFTIHARAKPLPIKHTMNLIDWVGSLAAFLTTASFIPQAWQTFRTRDVSGISLGMYSLFTVGVALWLVYGILLLAWPIIIANVITTSLALMILLMKLRYR